MPATHDETPSLPLFLSEIPRAIAELGLYFAAQPLVPALPRGDGHPVLVLPGLEADDTSTLALRDVLNRLGYRAHGWQLGRNIGPTAASVRGMEERIAQLVQRYDRSVSVIGWSLGGIFARNIARRAPEAVRQVITLGSPIRMARESQSRVHDAYAKYSHLHVESANLPLEHDAEPLTVPATSIYSRFDGIVAWQACLDVPGPRAENIAVTASHIGMGHHPAAIYAVADRLAQAEGTWRPFSPPAFLQGAFPRPDRLPAEPLSRTPRSVVLAA